MSFLGTLVGGALGYATGGLSGALLGSSLGGSVDAANAAQGAAQTQADAANRAADLQYKMWQEQQAQQKPWLEAGQTALNKLIPLATNYTPFGTQQFQQDPGYAFRLSEGQKALERSAAARGGLLSGAAGKALVNYGQQAGSQEYQNAFNRYQAERAAQLQPLQSLAGVGQTAANTLGSAAGQYGTNAANLMTSGAAAQAAGQVGAANALTGGLSTYMNYNAQNNLLNALRGGGSSYSGYVPYNAETVIPMQAGGGY